MWKRTVKEEDPDKAWEREEHEMRVRNLKEIFSAHDVDGNGSISKAELKPLITSLGFVMEDHQIDGVMEEMMLLASDEAEISFEEFTAFVGHQQGMKDLDIKQVWPLFDTDNSGALSFEEMLGAMNQCGMQLEPDEIDEMWKLGDLNSDGKITYDEFTKVSTSAIWKKAIMLLSTKQLFVNKLLVMSDIHQQWQNLQDERASNDWAVERSKLIMRCSLRDSPSVRKSITDFWDALEGLRTQDMVERPLFVSYFMKIARVILKDEFQEDKQQLHAQEEWVRQCKRYSSCHGGVATDRIDFDVFFESMFELVDYEVAGHAGKKISASTYAAFMRGLMNQLVEEKVCRATRRRQKGKVVSERDKLSRTWAWVQPNVNNETARKQWESIDRKAQAKLLAQEAAQRAREEEARAFEDSRSNRVYQRLHSKKLRSRGNALAIFEQVDLNGDGVLTLEEISCKLSDFGLSDRDIEQLMFAMDTNRDGVVDQQEFIASFDKWQEATTAVSKQRAYGGTLKKSQSVTGTSLPVSSAAESKGIKKSKSLMAARAYEDTIATEPQMDSSSGSSQFHKIGKNGNLADTRRPFGVTPLAAVLEAAPLQAPQQPLQPLQPVQSPRTPRIGGVGVAVSPPAHTQQPSLAKMGRKVCKVLRLPRMALQRDELPFAPPKTLSLEEVLRPPPLRPPLPKTPEALSSPDQVRPAVRGARPLKKTQSLYTSPKMSSLPKPSPKISPASPQDFIRPSPKMSPLQDFISSPSIPEDLSSPDQVRPAARGPRPLKKSQSVPLKKSQSVYGSPKPSPKVSPASPQDYISSAIATKALRRVNSTMPTSPKHVRVR